MKEHVEVVHRNVGGGGGAVYGLGFIGAVVYYIIHAGSVVDGVIGFVKAIFWPGFVIYSLMDFLKM